jgi:hypothetical protein
MIDDDDRAQMRADLLSMRDDNETMITIRRGALTLPQQAVRVARLSAGSQRQSQGAKEKRAQVVVVGDMTLDIQVDDRFTINGIVYRVTFMRPNRTAATMAEAEAVE